MNNHKLTIRAVRSLIGPWTTDPRYGATARKALTAIGERCANHDSQYDWSDISGMLPRDFEVQRFVGDLYTSWMSANAAQEKVTPTVDLSEAADRDQNNLPEAFGLLTDIMVGGVPKGYTEALTHSTSIDGPIYDINKRVIEFRNQYAEGETAAAETTLGKVMATAYVMLRDYLWDRDGYRAAALRSNFQVPDWLLDDLTWAQANLADNKAREIADEAAAEALSDEWYPNRTVAEDYIDRAVTGNGVAPPDEKDVC